METKVSSYLIVLLMMFMGFALAVSALPQGPDLVNQTNSTRRLNNSDGVAVLAQAGNVSSVSIRAVSITQAWQGYYGNVTGVITLDDANNYTFYDWSSPNPNGEIYASNGTGVTWSRVYCMNVSQNGSTPLRPDGTVSNINGSQIELLFGINVTDFDGLNETFNDSYVSATGFRVGAITIDTTDGCSMAHPYQNQLYNSVWQEVLLSDNTSIIFTSLIVQDTSNFQNSPSDFQMLVLENGHAGSEATTSTYFFYVELS